MCGNLRFILIGCYKTFHFLSSHNTANFIFWTAVCVCFSLKAAIIHQLPLSFPKYLRRLWGITVNAQNRGDKSVHNTSAQLRPAAPSGPPIGFLRLKTETGEECKKSWKTCSKLEGGRGKFHTDTEGHGGALVIQTMHVKLKNSTWILRLGSLSLIERTTDLK